LNALLSDSILRNRPGSIFLDFDGLLDGVYSFTSYHHDTQFGSTLIPFDVIVSDGLVASETLLSGLDTSGGTAPTNITTATIAFSVVSGSSVTVEFSGLAQNAQHMSVNGFQLSRTGEVPGHLIPEPITQLLLTMGLLCIGAARRPRH
jgi:hypothetical protein